MREGAVGRGDDENTSVEPLRAAELGESIADDIGERETQTLLANLHADTQSA
jgi:hypothetical protein